MKKLITFALIIGATTFIQAQSNLVFNQVLNFNIGLGETVTVPEGKVWKLESGISQGEVLISSINQEYGNNLDSSNMDDYALQTYNMPLWLGQGTSLTYNGSTGDNFLSILEFNVVPISSSGSGTVDTGISNGALPGDDYTPGESFSDADGNTYDTVEINGQTWTTTNLNVSAYRDGTPIPYISDFDEWCGANTGAYTYAGQDSNAGYGKLYNVYALAGIHDNDGATPNKTLAPEGYHIPAPSEWQALIEFYMVGDFRFEESFGNANGFQADIASSFLKSQTSWNNNGTNESGLNVKNYPPIYSSNSSEFSSNFSEIADTTQGTYFATNQIWYFCCGYTLRFFGIRIGDFLLDTESLNGNNVSNVSQTGTYVRLIKDY